MREAYRLNKPAFYESVPAGEQLALMIIYTYKEEKDFSVIERSMQKALKKLTDSLS